MATWTKRPVPSQSIVFELKNSHEILLGSLAAGGSASVNAISQSFTLDSDQQIARLSFKLARTTSLGAVVGDMVARVFSLTGTYASTAKPNALLHSSSPVDSTVLPLEIDADWINFDFPTLPLLLAGQYVIVSDMSGVSGVGSIRHYIDGDNGHGGVLAWRTNAGTWLNPSSLYDLNFRFYTPQMLRWKEKRRYIYQHRTDFFYRISKSGNKGYSMIEQASGFYAIVPADGTTYIATDENHFAYLETE